MAVTRSGYVYHAAAGETFDSMAVILYGDEKYTPQLLEANPELCKKYMMDGGEIVYLPLVEIKDYDGLPINAPWKEG